MLCSDVVTIIAAQLTFLVILPNDFGYLYPFPNKEQFKIKWLLSLIICGYNYWLRIDDIHAEISCQVKNNKYEFHDLKIAEHK